MTIKTRRLIYITFMLIFLIAAPILILYAAGYRYNFKKTKFQKTGAIFAETEPKGADIFIENEKKLAKTANQIGKLLPGEYSVRLEKDGYFPWQKKLTVEPEKVVFIKKLILLKNSQVPALLLEKPILASLNSPDNQNSMAVILNNGQQELWLTALTRQQNLALALEYQTDKTFELVNWSPSSKKILIKIINKKQIDYLIINVEKPEEITTLSEFTSLTWPLKDLIRIKWDLDNDNYLYGQKGTDIYKINLASRQSELQTIKTAGDFLLIGDSFFYWGTEAGYLLKNSLANPLADIKPIVKLPPAKNYNFLESLPNFIMAVDADSQNLFAINPNKEETIFSGRAKNIHWSADKQQLLYYNDWEMWIYYLADNSKELIARYGNEIEEVVWYPLGGYLFFNQKTGENQNELIAIELDSRDYRQTFTLAKAEKIDGLATDSAGANVFFSAKIGNQEGLYGLEVH